MIGINPGNWSPIGTARSFVTSKGLTFTNLWDGPNVVWRNYGSPYTSRIWMLDSKGDRVGDTVSQFSYSTARRLLDSLG